MMNNRQPHNYTPAPRPRHPKTPPQPPSVRPPRVHGRSHLPPLAQTKLVYGPTVEGGFYYDIDLDDPIRPDDFERIEAEMAQIAQRDAPFVRVEMTRNNPLANLPA
jgi:hypothetical protein